MSAARHLDGGRRCLLCGGEQGSELAMYEEPDRYETAVGVPSQGYLRSWVQCDECALVFSAYTRDPRALDRLYERVYREVIAGIRSGSTREIFQQVIALPPERSETHERVSWIKGELRHLEQAGLVPARTGRRRLLDIGGATGVFAYTFRDEGWETSIVDPAESGRFIEAEHGIPYRQETYRPGLFETSFDLLSLVFVLEHLRDPIAALRGMADDLEEGGLLYVEVPDAAAFELKDPSDDIFSSPHLWMFDPTSLTRLLDAVGFEVMSLRRTRTLRGHYAVMTLARPNPARRSS